MKRLIFILCFSLFTISCGPEILVLVLLPAISATWCAEDDACHKFSLWPDRISNSTDNVGIISGREFFIDPTDGAHFKEADFSESGDNQIIGTYDELNIAFIVHKRKEGGIIEEEEFVGAMEVNDEFVDYIFLRSLTDGRELTLTRADGICDCQ